MPDLKLMREELEQTVVRRETLREQYKGISLPEDVRVEDQELHERALKLRKLIDDEETTARDRTFDELKRYMTDPKYVIQHPVNNDEDGHKQLAMKGWTFKDGGIYRETSAGEVAMYPEEVLFGPLPANPKDAEVANYFKQTRAIFQPAYREAYVKYMRSVRMEPSQAWSRLSAEEQKALSEGNDGAGGYLVPPDMQAEMLARLPQVSVFPRLARTVNTSRDRLVYPRVAAAAAGASGLASGGGSVFSSGFIGSWAGETPTFTDTDPAFGTFEISIKKVRVATKLSNDFMSDAVINVPQWLATNGAENMALVEEQGFITGDGTALKPMGILNGGAATVDVEGSSSNTISNSTSNTGSAPKLIDLVYGLPSQYANSGALLMKRSVEGKIRKLIDAQGRYLWPLQSGSMFGAPNGLGQRTLLEYPVYNSEFMPVDDTDANKVIIFGDFSAYIIARRTQLSTTILRERFADTDQTGIIIWDRVGGALWNDDAIRYGVV